MAQQGATIGRVNVKVMPDTDDFRRALKRQLDAIEKDADFKVKVELDTEHLKASLEKVKRELQDWKKDNDPLKIGVEVNMLAGQTTVIAARLAYLTRARTVPIIPVMNEGAAAKVATAIAALSGGRVLSDLLENLWDIGQNFDRLVPKIGAVGMALGGLTNFLLTGISNIGALSLSLAQMATATLALPGLFAGLAVGAGITVVALTTLKDELPELMDVFSQMREQIGANFWKEAGDGALALAQQYLPLVAESATGLGKFFGELGTQMATTFGPALSGMFDKLNESIAISTGNAGVFASIITSLGTAGSAYLPQLATWIGDLATQFDNFLKRTSESGELQNFIDSGIQGFKDFGNIIKNAALIIGDIGKAAQAGGGSTLGILADTMQRIRDVTSDPVFQTVLTSVFQAAHQSMSAIADTAGPALVGLFEALAGTLVAIGPAIGEGIGTALGAIAGALSDPALQAGIVTIFYGLRDAIVTLAPALTPVAQALASLAPVITSLLGVIAPLITAALIPLGEIIQILAPALVPLIDALGGALLQVVVALGPPLTQIALALVEVIAAAMPVINVILALLVPALKFLIDIIATTVLSIANGLTNMFSGITRIFNGFKTMFSGGWDNFWKGIKEVFAGFWQLIIGVVEVAFNIGVLGVFKKGFTVLKTLWGNSWKGLVDAAKMVWAGIQNLFKLFLSALAELPRAYLGLMKTVWTGIWNAVKFLLSKAWDLMVAAVKTYISTYVKVVGTLLGKAKDALSSAPRILIDAGKALITGFITGITAMFDKVKSTLGNLTSKLTSWKGPPSKDATLLYDAGKLVIGGFIDGLESQYSAVRKSLGGLSSDVGNFAVAAPNVGNINGAIDGSMTSGGSSKVFNYYAAPGSSLGSEEDLFAAADRARMVGW
jgi:phage-related protein